MLLWVLDEADVATTQVNVRTRGKWNLKQYREMMNTRNCEEVRSTIGERGRLKYLVLSTRLVPALALGTDYLNYPYYPKPFPFPGCTPLQLVEV
jgi:hypothetical protein